jgi:DNA repair photolyase
VEEIISKTILTKVHPNDNLWFHHDYNMNLYRGCSHGCIYCDSRSDCYHIENFDVVKPKKDSSLILEKELQTKRQKGIIGMGAMSDPYNPLEIKLEITRNALLLIEKYGFSVSIATKSDLILRDLDILERIAKNQKVNVAITITTANDELQSKIEPYASSTSARFNAIKKLREHGIFAGVLMMPILPFINDTIENIKGIVSLANKHQASYIYPAFGVTLRSNQREYFYQKLDVLFPTLTRKYQAMYGEKYSCQSPHIKTISAEFQKQCIADNIPYLISNINTLFLNQNPLEQLSFDL